MVESLDYLHTYVLYKLFSITKGSVEGLIDGFHIRKFRRFTLLHFIGTYPQGHSHQCVTPTHF